VIGTMDFLAYTLKFDGPGGDEIGIPVCTEPEDLNFNACKDVDGDTTIDDATETHRVKVWFLGEQWVISEMNAPVEDLANENTLVNGGSVKLAKEAVSGILNQGESLPVDDLKFQLDDLEAHGDETSAILSILDANGNVLKKDKVNPGQTKEFQISGKTYRFHVYKVAPGYTFGAKWADVAIFAKELELKDGQELDQGEDTNPGYDVALGWKNMDATTGDPLSDAVAVDTLRTIVLFSEDVEDISSSGEQDLEAGDYVSIVQDPEVWKLSYKGLDLTSDDRKSLKFEIKTTDKEISAGKGPFTSCSTGDVDTTTPTVCDDTGADPVQSKCIIYAPYVEVSSGDSGSVFSVDRSDINGELSDDQFFVALHADYGADDGFPGIYGPWEAASCDADNDGDPEDDTGYSPYWLGKVPPGAYPPSGVDFILSAGTVFMHTSPSSDNYGFYEYNDLNKPVYAGTGDEIGTEVSYDAIGDGDNEFAPPAGGAILIEDDLFGSVSGADEDQLGDLLESVGYASGSGGSLCTSTDCADFYFAIAEKAGTGPSNEFVDYWMFGITDVGTGTPGDATFDFESSSSPGGDTMDLTSDGEEVFYGHATANPKDTGSLGGPNEYYDAAGTGIPTGPVTPGTEMVEEGYISERGSVFKSMDSDSVEFSMAHKLARAEWFLASSSTAAGSEDKTIVTLGEGESTTISGVTVKVLEITETVGACSAGGAVSCTADMSGVSAKIMPNNAPSVQVALPAAYAGNLVILDSDAAGVNTLVTVGGDKVNSVTADLLQAAPVDWTAETKVVKEVVAGSKIVVAGKEAADTLAAAQDFVAQVRKV